VEGDDDGGGAVYGATQTSDIPLIELISNTLNKTTNQVRGQLRTAGSAMMFLASNPQAIEPIKQNLGLSNTNIPMNQLAQQIIQKIRE
jgi:hypothetical protein